MNNQRKTLATLSPEERRTLLSRLLQKKGIKNKSAPLSFAQQRIWLLDQFSPSQHSFYNLSHVFYLRGPLHLAALQQALQQLCQRHESLRTTFPVEQGLPSQLITPLPRLPFSFLDLQKLAPAQQSSSLEELTAQESQRPFDLTRGPLLRVTLCQRSTKEHVLLLVFHQIVSDDSSLNIFVQELLTLYRSIVTGTPSPLPPLSWQYADYALWQRQTLQQAQLQPHLDYWKAHLVDLPPLLTLPTDHPRPAAQIFHRAGYTFALAPSLTQALRHLSLQEDVTLFMILLSAFQLLLARYSGQQDIVVGTPAANRNQAQTEDLIGLFVNTLVLRTNLADNPTLRELLQRVRQEVLEAYAHQDLPFEKLAEALHPERDLNSNPLFQVTFALEQRPPAILTIEQLSLERHWLPAQSGLADLDLHVWEQGEDLLVELTYNADCFASATITRLAEHLQVVLTEMTTQPDQRSEAFSLLTLQERHQILVEWNATKNVDSTDLCMHQHFEQQVALTPDAVITVAGSEHVTYSELNRRANRLAKRLQQSGVGPTTRVGVCLDRSTNVLVSCLGILKAGGVYVPLDPNYPSRRLQFILEDARIALFITEEQLERDFSIAGLQTIYLHNYAFPWQENADLNPDNPITPDYPAYIIYTSGSTGQPKGTLLTHRGLFNFASWQRQEFAMTAMDRASQIASPAFDAANAEIWPCITRGGSLFFPENETRITPSLLQAWIMQHAITVSFLPTPLAEHMLQLAWPTTTTLRLLFIGGEKLSSSPSPALPFQVFNCYGPTEATICATSNKVTPVVDAEYPPSIGYAIANTEVYILDKHMQPVPAQIAGEIYIGGVGLAWGYLNKPDLTAERFVPHLFSEEPGARLYRTGDLAAFQHDGSLVFIGRTDEQVKIRGFRIELEEIAHALKQQESVQDVIVVARPDMHGVSRLVAYIVATQALLADDLQHSLKALLPAYMIPSVFLQLEALPLSPNGKVDRQALPDPETLTQISAKRFVAPRNPIEEMLVDIWTRLLGREQIGIFDNFFDLGGHSLLITQVISRIRSIFQIELSLPTFFEIPTIAGLAEYIQRAQQSEQQIAMIPLVASPRPKTIPLSFAQQRIWLLDQFSPPNHYFYNLSHVFHLHGPLHLAALQQSLQQLCQRHEILRTIFPVEQGLPCQRISPLPHFPFSFLDLQGLAPTQQSASVEQLIAQESQRPFDLTRGPLLRATLLQRSADERVLLLVLHHIILDGWSLDIFARELLTLYGSAVAGTPSPLQPLSLQYADYALWQRQALQQAELQPHLDYWKAHLVDLPPLLTLPTDHPRPAAQTFRGAGYTFVLSPALTQALKHLSLQEGVTLFMTLLSAFQLLLARYSGQQDIVVGTPIANRNQAQIEDLIGFFVNSLVLRTNLSGNPTLRELLQRVRQVALEAYAHQDLPFEKLVEELHPERDLSFNPLFQVMFLLQNTPQSSSPASAMGIQSISIRADASAFDLSLEMTEGRDGLNGILEYNTDLFEAATIEQMAVHFQTLLGSMVASPASPLSQLALLPQQEQDLLLTTWNNTQAHYPTEHCLHQLFELQVERTPDALALVYAEHHLTYRELNRRSNQLAHYLRTVGVGPEVSVGICTERSLEMIIGLLGILKAGGVYVPLDPAYPKERQAFLLQDTQAPVLLIQQHLASRVPELEIEYIALDTYHAAIAAQETTNPLNQSVGAHAAYIVYTSGSTGRPKGVTTTHHNICQLLHWGYNRTKWSARDRVLQYLSFFFDWSAWEIFMPLTLGASLHLIDREMLLDADKSGHFMRESAITVWHVTPTQFRFLAKTQIKLEQLRWICFGAEKFEPDLLSLSREMLSPECRIFNAYGPTEATVTTTIFEFAEGTHSSVATRISIGKPISNMSCYVLDRDYALQPIGVPGELYISGEGLARDYKHRPDLTAEKFVPNPFAVGARMYKTGDRVRWLPDGTLEFLGRIDYQIKLRGFRVELGEIETTLMQHPDVQEGVVLVREEAVGDKRLVAYVVPRQKWVSSESLRHYLQERLPDYMIPASVVLCEALPLSPNGKVDRRALQKAEPQMREAPEFLTEPHTPIAEVVADVWSQVLGIAQIGIHEEFFALGGHSLLATQVISRLRTIFQVDLPLRSLFEAPTVAGLAAEVQKMLLQQRGVHIPPIQVALDRVNPPLSFAQQRLWFLDQLTPGNTAYNLSVALRLRGNLRLSALTQSLQQLLQRQESLRTSFVMHEGQPIQLIGPAHAVHIPIIDLSQLPESRRAALAQEQASLLISQPYDLTRRPLWRLWLWRLTATEHVLSLGMHHIISDGWSLGILLRELTRTYADFVAGQTNRLPVLPIQYVDYTLWQRQWLQGEALQQQIDYWKQQLAGAPLLDLPTDAPRPHVQTYQGAGCSLLLPLESVRALELVSRDAHVTLFMTLLSTFALLLSRYSGQEDLVIGTPIANRTHADIENIVGFFINTLALRIDLSGEPPFLELLARVRDMTLQAYTYQELPFEQVVQALSLPRTLGHTPLFQVFFNMLNLPHQETLPASELQVEQIGLEERTAKFDLTLYLTRRSDGLQLRLVYNAALFTEQRMQTLLSHFQTLLQQIIAHPEQPISAFSLTQGQPASLPDPTEQLDETWYGAIHQRLSFQASRQPQAIAIHEDTGSWSYQQLEQLSNQLAHYLSLQGVGKQDTVAIFGTRSATLLWAIFAVLKTGAAYCIIDPAYPPARQAAILKELAPRASLQMGQKDAMPALVAEEVASLPPEAVVYLPATPSLAASGPWSQLSNEPPQLQIGPDDLAVITFTSGTAGVPRGVCGRHGSLTHFLPWLTQTFDLQVHDRFALLAGLAHDPLQREIFTSVWLGATVCIPVEAERFQPGYLREWLRRERVTILHATPSLLQLLASGFSSELQPERAGGDASASARPLTLEDAQMAVRLAFVIGENLTRQTVALLREVAPLSKCVNLYGTTETQRALSYYLVPDEPVADTSIPLHSVWQERVPLGRGMPDVQLLILRTGEQLAGPGEVGEIWIRSPHLAQGYLHDEALTRQRFRVNPFTQQAGDRLYCTGDLGRYALDGTVEFVGRADQQVQVRGYRVELSEIEFVLQRQPTVQQAIVLLQGEQSTNPRLVAYLQPRPGARVIVEAIRRSIQESLPVYMVPTHFIQIERLPLTPNGKVDRHALLHEEPLHALTPGEGGSSEEAVTPTEEVLANIWEQILHCPQVGRQDDFFLLGGHSLLLTQMLSRVREHLHVEVPLRAVFEAPTLAMLAQVIDQKRLKPLAHIAELQAVSREQELPLSFAQERLWFLDQLVPENAAYNIATALRLGGVLHLDAFIRSLNTLVERQESLRTTFADIEGRPVQVIASPREVQMPVLDLQNLGKGEQEHLLRELLAQEQRQPFDLAVGPLWRLRLWRLGPEEHVMQLTMHHIISDVWSMRVFSTELAELYRAFCAADRSPLRALPIQYADYALWQRQQLNGTVLEQQLAYWKHQLADAPPVSQLQTDRPRPTRQSFRGASQNFQLPQPLSDALQDLGRQEGMTLFMTMLAAFQLLLMRTSGQEDIVVGTPVANRNRSETEALIGFFVNSLALRTNFADNPSVREALARVREVCLGAYAHQDLPFEQVVEALQPERSLSFNPLFQINFTLQNEVASSFELSGPALEALELKSQTTIFDLHLFLEKRRDGLYGFLRYSTDLFEAATIRYLLDHFQVLLEAIVADPEQTVWDLPLLTVPERQQLLIAGDSPVTSSVAQERYIHQQFEEQAARQPDAIALSYDQQVISYGELQRQADQLASTLRELGVGPDVLVALCVERSPEMVIGMLGILKAGGAYVPLDPSNPVERQVVIMQDAQVVLLLTQTRFQEQFAGLQVPVLYLDAARAHEHRQLILPEADRVQAQNLAYIIYTSGSTGTPKGVMLTHANVIRLFEQTTDWFHFQPDDVWTLFHSYAFDFSVWELWGALLHGGKLVIVPYVISRSPEEFSRLLLQEGVTILNQTPSAFRQLIQVEQADTEPQLAALRTVIFGGERLELSELQPWFARYGDQRPQLVNMYGITETTVHVTCFPITWSDLGRAQGSLIGRSIPDLQCYVFDARQQLAAVGVPGELVVGGAGLARGYLRRAAFTAERFVPHPFSKEPGARLYRTGDLVRYLPSGELEYLGRIDQQVKLRGFRIELGEIKAALQQHPQIKDAIVLLREGASGEKALIAYVIPREETGFNVGAVRRFLQDILPSYMLPSAFVSIPALPLNFNGKIDYHRLPAPDIDAYQQATYVAARTEIEQVLVTIWEDVLGIAPIGVADNYFALGGDSLRALQLIKGIHACGFSMTPADLFQYQQIADLAAHLVPQDQDQEQIPPLDLLPAYMDQKRFPPESIEDVYPATHMQELMLYHYEHDERHIGVYHTQQVYELTHAEVSLPSVIQALNELIRVNPALRTFFISEKGVTFQVVKRHEDQPIPIVDLRSRSVDEQRADLIEAINEDRQRPFDALRDQQPPLRLKLFRRTEQAAVLVLSMHHAIEDGWSHVVLGNQLIELALAFEHGKQPPQPELANPCKEFVALEQQIIADQRAQHFWRTYMADSVADILQPRQDYTGDSGVTHERCLLDTDLVQALQRRMRQDHVSMKALFLSAYMDVLREAFAWPTPVVGVVSNGRSERMTNALTAVGLFWNLVPISGHTHAEHVLERVREVQRELLHIEPYIRFPLPDIQRLAGYDRLFFATMNYTHFHHQRFNEQAGKMSLQVEYVYDKFHFPLNFSIGLDTAGNHAQLRVEYEERYFSQKMIQQLMQTYISKLAESGLSA